MPGIDLTGTSTNIIDLRGSSSDTVQTATENTSSIATLRDTMLSEITSHKNLTGALTLAETVDAETQRKIRFVLGTRVLSGTEDVGFYAERANIGKGYELLHGVQKDFASPYNVEKITEYFNLTPQKLTNLIIEAQRKKIIDEHDRDDLSRSQPSNFHI
jgi:hypothetical protein